MTKLHRAESLEALCIYKKPQTILTLFADNSSVTLEQLNKIEGL